MAVKEKDTEAVAVSEEKNKALKLAIEKIEKDFGKGSIMKLGDKTAVACEAIPTGALALDLALGIGGVPRGRVIEVYGPRLPVKQHLPSILLQNAEKRRHAHLLMQNMRLILNMQELLA